MKKYIELADGSRAYADSEGDYTVGGRLLYGATVEALDIEIHEEVEVPTYFGAIVRYKNENVNWDATRIRADDNRPWIANNSEAWADSEIQSLLDGGYCEVYVPEVDA